VKRPIVTCLCGSTRFASMFREVNLKLTLQGEIVLSIGADLASDDEHFGHLSEKERTRLKIQLDILHLRKIDLCDRILVLNVGGYIGDSTLREIEYAKSTGKEIMYLERGWHT
jgi:hypothetical protein